MISDFDNEYKTFYLYNTAKNVWFNNIFVKINYYCGLFFSINFFINFANKKSKSDKSKLRLTLFIIFRL